MRFFRFCFGFSTINKKKRNVRGPNRRHLRDAHVYYNVRYCLFVPINGKTNWRNIGGTLFGRTTGNRREPSICPQPIVRVHRDGSIHTRNAVGALCPNGRTVRVDTTIFFSDFRKTRANARCHRYCRRRTEKITDGIHERASQRADNGRTTRPNRPGRTRCGGINGSHP